MNPLRAIFGSKNDRDIKKMKPLVKQIGSYEEQIKKLSDEELKAQTPKFRKMLSEGATLSDILPEAYATVREASVRVLGMRPYDVQLVGGIALFEGNIAEMKTGEGKTLTAALPMYLHGLTQKGAHLVTVNDYLARRDAEEMVGPLYEWLGLTVGVIIADMDEEDRKKAYQADITYGTNNEFAFDYLRDNMKFDLEDYVQRGHNYCIVDEVDSILIDEARTPLLISGPSEGKTDLYYTANEVMPKLVKEEDYTVDEKSRTATYTETGLEKIQKILKIDDLFNLQHNDLLHHLNQALKAHHLFKKDIDYVIKEEKVIIVDEFTGRLKDGSRWSDGLHQAVEAKENVPIKSENQTLASVTFQNYFRLYDKLAGMTGTAETEAEEFRKIYKLDVLVVPTNVPIARIDEPDVIYKSKEAKTKAVIKLVRELNAKGQPILIGTNSIDSSEHFHKSLTQAGIKHEMLNAKNHEREAQIIVKAGEIGSVTIATNMAGRGTDIKINDEVKALGGLYIVGTERNEARRIDNQLRGRSGRQGDPGHSKFFLSLEDDLMRIFGSDRIKGMMNTLGMEEDEPIEHKMISNAIAKSQKKVEAHNFEIRKHLLQYDDVMGEQRSVIYRLRRDILADLANEELLQNFIEDVSESLIDVYRPDKKVPLDSWSWEDMQTGFQNTFHTELKVTHDGCIKEGDGEPEVYFAKKAKEILEKKFSQYDPEQVKLALREVLLSTFDQHWKDHLQSMDHIKEGINLRAYAQKDPLTEYKREAFNLFEDMRGAVKKAVVNAIFSVKLYTQEEIEQLQKRHQEELERQLAAHKAAQEMAEEARSQPIQRSTNKVGRNDACPCGSGKKFKHCHGA
ncbi:MAG: preprotein translocase subunit SecA [Bacteriovoracaceae bacterium]|nr:preprotein translocase subunit SecA [Bacteriovoracaceae bacterium]